MELYLRIALSFLVVGFLLWLFSRAARGRLGARLRGSMSRAKADPLAVIERRQLTKSNAVAIIRAGRRHLLVGYGEQGVQLLAEGDDLADVPVEPQSPDRNTLDEDLASSRRDDEGRIEIGPSPAEYQSARTRLPTATRPTPPRMTLMDALREKTVRRS